MRRLAALSLLLGCCLLPATAALAHPGHDGDEYDRVHPWVDGLLHPLTGVDHLLAMVAVGLLAARLGGRAAWLVPAAFLGAMGLGGAIAGLGGELPWIEYGIAGSVAIFGLLVALGSNAGWRVCLPIVAAFALLHGWAHVAEMSAANSASAYVGGFLLSTAALHAAGAAIGLALSRGTARRAFPYVGAGIAACSLPIIAGWL